MNKEDLQDIGVEGLRFAICEQAVKDYKDACKHLKRLEETKADLDGERLEQVERTIIAYKRMKTDSLRFFHSEWFKDLTGYEDVMVGKIIEELKMRYGE